MLSVDLCRTFHLSDPIEGFALVGHVIRNLAVEVESLCRVNCYMEADCVSFNIGSLQDGKYACEMSDSDHHTHPQDLVSWEGWVYGATIQVKRKHAIRPPPPPFPFTIPLPKNK